MSVIAPVKFYDFIPSGKPARNTHRPHHGLCTGVRKPHKLHGGKGCPDHFGQSHLHLAGRPKAGTIFDNFIYCLNNLWVCVSQDGWSPRSYIIYILIAIFVPDIGPFGTFNKWRSSSNVPKRPDGRINTANQNPFCSGKELL